MGLNELGTAQVPPPDRAFALAIGLMVMAAAFNAIDTLLVRVISTEMSAFSISFFRSAFGLLFSALDTPPPGPDIQDQLCLAPCCAGCTQGHNNLRVFYAIARANLAQVTAIAFTTPIFVIIGAVIILREKLGLTRLLSVLMGFGGVLLIVRPIAGQFDPYLLFALVGALVTAAIQLVLKAMSGRDSTDTLVAWNLILMVPLALLPALFFWTTPSPMMLGLLAIQGAIGAMGMTAITKAMSLADVSAVIPFDFLRLPLVAFGAFYFFGQSADAATWLGAAIIFVAVVAASRRVGRPVAQSTASSGGAADMTELDIALSLEKVSEEEGKKKENG